MTIRLPRVVVAIPVRNEVELIGPCLRALALQNPMPDLVVLLLNNCSDGTAQKILDLQPALKLQCQIVECELSDAEANAGHARSLAMRHAAAGLSDHDVLVTTDADGRADPNWLAANLACIHRGADVVCGRAVIDASDALSIPINLHEDDARERQLSSLMDEVASIVDPDPNDPWPRHTEHSGASIAVTIDAWRRAGGVPAVACGEDRAFVDHLRRLDARIRHEPSVHVTVSGRCHGRAAGGMADTIRRRIRQQDMFADDAIEPVSDAYRRIVLRAETRALWSGRHAGKTSAGYRRLAASLSVRADVLRAAMANPAFGQVWNDLERDCEVLRRRRLRFSELPLEIHRAGKVLTDIRGRQLGSDLPGLLGHAAWRPGSASPVPA